MGDFDPKVFIKRIAGYIGAPSATVREAIDDDATTDAIAAFKASLALAAAAVAANLAYVAYAHPIAGLSVFSMWFIKAVAKGVIGAAFWFAMRALAYYYTGAAFKGSGSLREMLIACGISSLPSMLVRLTGLYLGTAAYYASRVAMAFIDYFAVREAHRFDEAKDAALTVLIASVIVGAADRFLMSFGL